MKNIKILWVDDEIELLQPHFLFLEARGYDTTPLTNGRDAIEIIQKEPFDVVLLDENMPGLNGLETLVAIKQIKSLLPVIMITKNEEEHIMNEAIGLKISDYLIKPVNPNQILLALKRILDDKTIIAEKTAEKYQKAFGKMSLELTTLKTAGEWIDFYKKTVFWELELEGLEDSSMLEIFESQKKEANREFGKFIEKNYTAWMAEKQESAPTLSHRLFKSKILPELQERKPTLLLVIDNLRFDQWRFILPELRANFSLEEESAYFSILPTATQYARNAIFSGLTPLKMKQLHPQWWLDDHEEGGKNQLEEVFLSAQIERLKTSTKFSYHKITNAKQAKQLTKKLQNHTKEELTVVVYNFVDMISHAKTEMEIIKELAPDNKAYRSLTLSWFKNSPLNQLLQKARALNYKLIITSDHGTINVSYPSQVIGDRETSLNLRYKTSRSLSFEKKHVLEVSNPQDFELPSISINSPFIFAKEQYYFVYKNNFNHYADFFRNTFQHGGISMEEMIVPFAVLSPR